MVDCWGRKADKFNNAFVCERVINWKGFWNNIVKSVELRSQNKVANVKRAKCTVKAKIAKHQINNEKLSNKLKRSIQIAK